MSGGLDSTSVAAVACNIARKNGDERPAARLHDRLPAHVQRPGSILASLVAENLGMDIEILSGAYCLPYEVFGEDSLRRTPEAVSRSFSSSKPKTYRKCKPCKVVLSGTVETTS